MDGGREPDSDEDGEPGLLASMLGDTPQTQPERVPFLLDYDVCAAE